MHVRGRYQGSGLPWGQGHKGGLLPSVATSLGRRGHSLPGLGSFTLSIAAQRMPIYTAIYIGPYRDEHAVLWRHGVPARENLCGSTGRTAGAGERLTAVRDGPFAGAGPPTAGQPTPGE